MALFKCFPGFLTHKADLQEGSTKQGQETSVGPGKCIEMVTTT